MSDWITQAVDQANIARVEGLIEMIRHFGYQGKHQARLAH